MADYGSLVCKDCVERLILGKIIWVPDSGKSHARGFLSGLAGGRGHEHNWQEDDLNYSLYAMLAKHCGHNLTVLTTNDMSELFPGWVPRFPDEPVQKHARADLMESSAVARIVPPDESDAFPLGHLLLAQRSPMLFTGYFDQLANPELAPEIWRFLARQLSQPLIVETV